VRRKRSTPSRTALPRPMRGRLLRIRRARLAPLGWMVPTHLCLRLLEPELHAHFLVHGGAGGEVRPGLLSLAGAPVEAAGARRDSGQRVGACRALQPRSSPPDSALRASEKTQVRVDPISPRSERECLHAALAISLRGCEGSLSKRYRIARTVGEEVDLTQMRDQGIRAPRIRCCGSRSCIHAPLDHPVRGWAHMRRDATRVVLSRPARCVTALSPLLATLRNRARPQQ
jgi:hypothetical protein